MRRMLFITLLLSFTLTAMIAAQESRPAGKTEHLETQESAAMARWSELLRGNREFTAGRVDYGRVSADRVRLVASQDPRVSILGCSDSRVPPELVFNQDLGSLFVVRTAGNVADEFGIASLEFAVASGFTDLIVVLGHQGCGAVKAALDHGEPGTSALRALVGRIRNSFVGVDWMEKSDANLQLATEANARSAANELLAASELIRTAAASGALEVVSAYYDFSTGEVRRVH